LKRCRSVAGHRCAAEGDGASNGGSKPSERIQYAALTPWQRVLVARHPSRPGLEDFIQRLFPGFIQKFTATGDSPTITRS
jgi:acetyl-CoA carboxylase alpha subunit